MKSLGEVAAYVSADWRISRAGIDDYRAIRRMELAAREKPGSGLAGDRGRGRRDGLIKCLECTPG